MNQDQGNLSGIEPAKPKVPHQSKQQQIGAILRADDKAAEKKTRGPSKAVTAQAGIPIQAKPGAPEVDSPGPDAEGDPQPAKVAAPDAPEKAAPKSVKELAERLGMDVEAVYGLSLDLAGEKGAVSLGQIKDYLQEYGLAPVEISAELARRKGDADAADAMREQTAAEQLAMRRELVGLMGAMGKVPRELAQRVEGLQRDRLMREMTLTLDAAPEWKNPERFEADRNEMVDILRPYGFTRVEVNQIDDSRLMLFMRDQVKRARQVRALRESAGKDKDGESESAPSKANQRPGARGQAPTQAQRIVRSGREGDKTAKVSAVSALLNQRRK